ncbi:SPOR domain-containing protein [Marinicauda salina]|nr:SPOR domain-containing protein [Marinicauda salina]
MRRFMLIAAALAVTGCASGSLSEETEPSSASAATPAARQALALAGMLEARASRSPDDLDRARTEMTALERALTAAPEAAEPMQTAAAPAPTEPAPARRPAAIRPTLEVDGPPPPAPDLEGSASLLYAIHLASYRGVETLEAGWSQLRAAHPELAELRPRMARVDLGERGVFLRLKAGPFDTAEAAQAACRRIGASEDWCATADFTGEPLADSGE